MNFKPLYDRVLVEPEIKNNVSSSGIVLPETSQERPQIGIVIAVGDGENFDGVETKIKVKIGERVLFQRYAGNEVKIEGKTYVVLRQIDVVGVFNDWKNCSSRSGCKKQTY